MRFATLLVLVSSLGLVLNRGPGQGIEEGHGRDMDEWGGG
jgi:hypothetical protein